MLGQANPTYMLNSGGRGFYSLTIPVSASLFEVHLKTPHNQEPEYIVPNIDESMFIKLNVPPFATFVAQKEQDEFGRDILVITSVNSPCCKIKVNVNGSDYFV